MTAPKTFRAALAATKVLKEREGLKAIKRGEGKGLITAADSKAVLGSAAIDDDYEPHDHHAARWDYVIGYDRAGEPVAYFVEVHSADSSGVSEVGKKFRWLCDLLEKEPQAKLRALKREVHWVASGRVNLPPHLPQYKHLIATLRPRGLNGPSKALVLT